MGSVETFEALRPLLFAIAYRMLGTVAEAEDIVQDAFLRWRDVDESSVDDAKSYLSAIVTRLAIDLLRSARVRREQYVGPWLPEPLVASDDDAAAPTELAESLSMAFLVVLESLSPVERAAFVLREVFDYPYADVAAMLARSEAACRQLVHRARESIAARRPRFEAARERQEQLTQSFLSACASGDVRALMSLLTEDAELLSDGGGNVRAAQRPIRGRDKIARFLLAILDDAPADMEVEVRSVNGGPGVVSRSGGRPFAVMTLDSGDEGVRRVHLVVNPDKLRNIP